MWTYRSLLTSCQADAEVVASLQNHLDQIKASAVQKQQEDAAAAAGGGDVALPEGLKVSSHAGMSQ